MHLNSGPEGMESMMQNMRKVNGAYKFTGSGALGDKQARLAAAAYLNATKVSALAYNPELNSYVNLTSVAKV